MKVRLLSLVLVFAVGTAYAQDNYIQFQTIYLKPDTKHLGTLAQNMKAHNDNYHSAAPYHANVWQVANGPKGGWLVWSMGPATFAHLDDRPSGEGHDEDWANNVMPYVTDIGLIEFWRMNQELSMPPAPGAPHVHIRVYKVNNEMGFLIGDLWEKISATMKAMPEGRPWALYNNIFRQGDMGRHLAELTAFESMADLDKGMNLDPMSPGSFRPTFEGIYGAAAWGPFSDAMNAAFKDSFDEIWSLNTAMSAPPLPPPGN